MQKEREVSSAIDLHAPNRPGPFLHVQFSSLRETVFLSVVTCPLPAERMRPRTGPRPGG